MISAVDAKRIADDCDISKDLKEIEELIKEAAERGYWRVDFNNRSLSIGKRQKIEEVLRELGYEINGCSISWENAGDGEEWIKRKRYDGSSFYVCGKCGGVAAAEKEDQCPNCRCKMKKD